MAKKRSGGGSNLGLIITLIFFVLTTVILGVTTYLGFADIEKNNQEKKAAVDAKTVAENDAKYNRMIARAVFAWTGNPIPGVDAAETARDKKQFDDNQFAPANNQKDKEAVSKLFQTLNQSMPWDAGKDTSPSQSYETRIGKLTADIETNWKPKLKKAEESVKRGEQDRKDLEDAKVKEIDALRVAIDDLRKKAGADRAADLKAISDQQVIASAEGKKRGDLAKEKDDLANQARKLAKEVGDLQGKMAVVTKDLNKFREERDDLDVRLRALYEKSGYDANAVEASTLDASARKLLESWNKNWNIVELDRRGELPFINLGTSDRINPQVTFSIHSMGPNGKLNPIPKGTLEVVRVVGTSLSQARITSVKDARKDPIVKGDRLFNPTWDPSRKRRVAIAGVPDLGGDVSDGAEDMKRLLSRQNVLVDAYIDLKDDKGPKIVGRGISAGRDGTDYLIIAKSLDEIKHPKAKDKDYNARYERLMRELRDKANNNGVTIISLRRYLDMIGYQPPRIVSGGSSGN